MTLMSGSRPGAAESTGPEMVRSVHDVARDEGLPAGLRVLAQNLAPGGVPFGPSGYAVLPAGTPTSAAGRRLFTIAIGTDAVFAARTETFEPADDTWLLGVSRLRLGVSRRLLRLATEHVAGRTVGAERLVQQQMVKGMIAEALTEQLEAESMLDGRTDRAVLAGANARIDTADRTLLRLFGASGFQAGPTSHTCWASELLADAYLDHRWAEGAS